MSDEILVKVEHVRKKFCRSLKRSLWYGMSDMASEVFGGRDHEQLRKQEFWAVNGVSFELRRGQCLGLIGRNGAGKTTLLRMLSGLIKPDAGRIEMRGRIGALIALGAGFNPLLTGRENIYVNGSVLGLTKREIDEKIEDIIDFAEIRDFIDSPVQSYSSGMQVRLGFSVATAMSPDVLILDEVLAVGDAAFRNKCYRRIVSLRKQAAVIFVSHNMEQVSRVCEFALLLSKGQMAYHGAVPDGITAYERLNESGDDVNDTFLSLTPPITGFVMRDLPDEIPSGSPLSMRLEIDAAMALPSFLLRINFYNSSGGFAADCNFFAADHGINLQAGRNVFHLTIADLPFKNGKYRLGVALIDQHGDLIVWSYKQHVIRVHGAYGGNVSDIQLRLANWRTVDASATPH